MTDERPPLPAAIERRLDEPLKSYWARRLQLHNEDSYLQVPLAKFPEDLHVYEQIMWAASVNVVIEIGTEHGGSTLWFRDRLRAMFAYGRIATPLVVAIDIEPSTTRANLANVDPGYTQDVEIVEGDVLDPKLPDRVEALLPADSRCLVIEDSAHVYETTFAALDGFARFVSPGGFFVVEDGTIDIEELRFDPTLPRGVLPAVNDWLESPSGAEFHRRRDLEIYGLTAHPGGFLQRSGSSAAAHGGGTGRDRRSARDAEIAALAHQLAATQDETRSWRERALTAESNEAEWQRRASRSEELANHARDLAAAAEERRADIQRRFDEVVSSRSWQITRPLRMGRAPRGRR